MLKNLLRPRYIMFALLLVFVPLLDVLTDPNTGIINNVPFGESFIAYLVVVGRAAMAVLALHWLVSFIFDTLELDVVKMAKAHPEHNGIYILAVSLFAVAFAIVIQSVLSL